MSSSSSDSDSDEFEPIRKIKINIRPKEEAVKRGAADISEIKASVKAWRPLGPPTHPSLSRRQSSLSSVSSMTFGANNLAYGNSSQNANPMNQEQSAGVSIRSSPSCSSLVNEFNNRSSFSNFMSTTSRTSSPLTLLTTNHSDPIPIAIAIQESIELIIRGHYDPSASGPKYSSRYMGNIKVAFPHAFARSNLNKLAAPALKLRLHSTENIIRYYASRLIKDLDLGTNCSGAESTDAFSNQTINNLNTLHSTNGDTSSSKKQNLMDLSFDFFDDANKQVSSSSSSSNVNQATTTTNLKIIEFDMEALINHLRKMYDQSPTSRYYNVDVLRYQIAPIRSIEECPLQVCAYWKVEADLVKLRIDFKHSSKSGLQLERLREINFTVNFSQFIPPGIDVASVSPDSLSTLRLTNNNNNSGAMNMNNFESVNSAAPSTTQQTVGSTPGLSLIDADSVFDKPIASGNPNVSSGANFIEGKPKHTLSSNALSSNLIEPNPHGQEPVLNSTDLIDGVDLSTRFSSQTSAKPSNNQQKPATSNNPAPPYITYEPQASWNNSIKQLNWKFDTLLSYHKTDGFGSLFAKLDFRNYHGMPPRFLENCKPTPVDVKFLIIDSTVSKISLSIDSMGYRMSLLKKEIRSGRYKSEPYIL